MCVERQLQPSKESTIGQEREGGLRTTVKDRHCLITAAGDGEPNPEAIFSETLTNFKALCIHLPLCPSW